MKNTGPRAERRAPLVAILALLASGCGGNGDDGAPPPPPEPDATLASLDLAGGELDQPFEPGRTTYTASVGYLTGFVEISAAAADPAATIEIEGSAPPAGSGTRIPLVEGSNSIEIAVTNDSEQQAYTLSIDRAALGERAYLKGGPLRRDTYVGTSMAASGRTLVTGAPTEDGNVRGVNGAPADFTLGDSGAAYVFARSNSGDWLLQAYLKAANADAGDAFGYSVAVSGDIAVVGAPFESSGATGINGDDTDNSVQFSGAVYVFARGADGSWTQQAYIKASDAAAGDFFGNTVALDGDTLAVSARSHIEGTIYVFRRGAGGVWAEEAVLNPSDGAYDVGFAHALALNGNTLAAGAKWYGNDSAGAVYMFRRSDAGVWTEEPTIQGTNTGGGDYFGVSVALNADTLAVGAIGEASGAIGVDGDGSDNSASYSGAAYVFQRDGAGAWVQQAYIKASNTEAEDDFGYSVALEGDWLAVGAENEGSEAVGIGGDQTDNSSLGSGAVYLFARDAEDGWSQRSYIKGSNSGRNDRFGRSVAFTEGGLAVAAPFEDGREVASLDSGAVYVLE